MPNHVENNLIATGPRIDLIALKAFLNNKFDFDTIIPMPSSLKVPSGSRTEEAIAVARYALGDESAIKMMLRWARNQEYTSAEELYRDLKVKTIKLTTGDDDASSGPFVSLGELGVILLRNLLEYGCPTWYEWCRDHWGTKWNAYRVNVQLPIPDDVGNPYVVNFQTAWTRPDPVLLALSRIFPTLTFNHCFFDEGWGFAGASIIRNGEIKTEMLDLSDTKSHAFETIYRLCYGEDFRPDDSEDDDLE